MTNLSIRNALIAAGIAATLGVGVAGCGETANQPSRQAGETRAVNDTAQDTGEAVQAAGDAAAQAASDTWITTKVKSVLLADSEAEGLDISVDTKDGVVTLEGELTSEAAIDHVKALAMEVEGVRRVNFAALTVARR